jgi:hypothetical protein
VRSYFLFTGALLSLALTAAFGLPALQTARWVGSYDLDVYVVVRDASELTPVANAVVEVLEGPHSPLESQHFTLEDFQLCDHGKLVTDERGHTEFSHRFFAAGSTSPFDNSGYVDTGKVWLRVTAEDYCTTYMPVDRQTIRTRNMKEDSPIYVTIPVGKISPRTLDEDKEKTTDH